MTWNGQRIAAVQGYLRRAADFMATGDLTLILTEDGLRRLLNA